ncbi:SDR family oxidoreductase [Reinekea blandensis]|uniref:Oxidoreductase, short-chain dehydrogenase/reductase family protein n=1 Tax=Reinekea blandensis MED297 TaxID=314283 RepID=A4B9Y6_9GAMM|nr:SDR family oxidoreductase [Reinekea blandensis]EAR11437.1 oxidoreductase, short-chain dehydrogenase/reductase family protein [Reinekea sp. MED297] [Reinekea blandensis MED297]
MTESQPSPTPIALVTGASRGIGAATAVQLARAGYAVIVNYHQNTAAAYEVRDRIAEFGGTAWAIQADVSKESEVTALFEQIDSLPGTLKVLVNNVGVLKQQSRLADISVERFTQVLNTNVLSCFLCCRAAVRRMSTRHGGQGGAIVNVSSGASKSGSPNEYVDYAASKGAIDSLTRGLALEVADEGIRVNAVRPGLIYTEIHADGGEPGRVDRLAERIPMKRGGRPSEVAEAIVWLASDASSFVTGSFIDPSGGL